MFKPDKTCPKCESSNYRFRARRNVEAKDDQPAGIETKYRCTACEHTWKVRTVSTLVLSDQTKSPLWEVDMAENLR